MTEALRSLTPRGKGAIAAGILLVILAIAWGQRDLLAIGVLLIALTCAAAALLARGRLQLRIEREVTPSHVPVGGSAEVTLSVTNLSSRRTGTVLISEALPVTLGAPVRRVLEDTGAQRPRVTTYAVQAITRGRYELGPLTTTALDPFGLVRITRTHRSTASLLVVPRVEELADGDLRADHWGRGEGAAMTLAARGDEDVIPREYRQGDDLRRIHWRASARADDLMVRREETPWTRRATVLLDLRSCAHGGDGPRSSLEVALSAAASASVHLLRRGWSVRLVSTDGRVLMPTRAGAEGEGEALTTLALAAEWPGRDVAVAGAGDGLIVAVIGSDPAIASALGGRLARAPGQTGLALVLDSAAWFASDALPCAEVVDDLARAGWNAAGLTARPSGIADAWHAATAVGVRSGR